MFLDFSFSVAPLNWVCGSVSKTVYRGTTFIELVHIDLIKKYIFENFIYIFILELKEDYLTFMDYLILVHAPGIPMKIF